MPILQIYLIFTANSGVFRMFCMASLVLNCNGRGEIVTDNVKVFKRFTKAVSDIQTVLAKSGLKWKHAYAWPGDDYYAYIEGDSKHIQTILGDVVISIHEIPDDKRTEKYHNGNALTIAEYMTLSTV